MCSGAILLAASGILEGRNVTTHHLGFDMLKKVADEAAGGDSKINVLKTRWVDAGTTSSGVRIINAGGKKLLYEQDIWNITDCIPGVSSGIDTSLWVTEQLLGKEAADWAAEIAEFERRSKGWSEQNTS